MDTDHSREYVIGIDIGGTNFRIGGIDSNGILIAEPQKHSSRKLFETDRPTEILEHVISEFISSFPNYVLRGICIGFPGTVDSAKKNVISCPNLPAFTNINVSVPLEKRFQVPVIAEHDVLLLLSNDIKEHHLENDSCLVSFYVGTGFGNGIYIHGRFLDGKNGVAGELGHIPVYGKNTPCPCGNKGCIELFCAGKALEGLHSKYFSDIELENIFNYYTESPQLQEFIDYMAIAMSTEINILDPVHIILAGGVIHMNHFPYDALCEKIRNYTRKPYPAQSLDFIKGSNNPFAGIIGAGIYMWNNINFKQ